LMPLSISVGLVYALPVLTTDGTHPWSSMVVQKQCVLHVIEVWHNNTQRKRDG
jgi:hypothetical protein